MARYELTYEETITHTVIVEAETEDEAKQLAEAQIEIHGENEYAETTESYDSDSDGTVFRFCDELDD
jgi:hypothetical protein